MGEYKLGDPSLPFRISSRLSKTIGPLRRSTRAKKHPERFPSTQVQMEKITHTEAEKDNQSSAKIKLIRKMGKWTMHNEHGGHKSKRFKSNRNGEGNTNNRHGEGMSNKYKGTGHAGAQSERMLNNSVENKLEKNSNSEVNVNLKNIDNILSEQVPFSVLVPPVPAEETVCVDLRRPSPESFAPYLDHDYAIPRTKGVRFKGHQNHHSATKELEPQNEDEVEIIHEIPGVLKINEIEMKEEIEDLAETCIPQSATEEREPQNDNEVEIIGEILTGVLKINETEMKEDIEDLAEACMPQSATQETEPQNVDKVAIFGEIPAGLQKIDETQMKDEASISSVTNEELSTTKSMNKHDNVVQNIIKGGYYLNEVTGCFQNIVKEESEPENKDEVQTVGETDKSPTVQNVINTETIEEIVYPDEIVKSEGSLGEDEAGYRRQSVDEVVNGTANMVRGVGTGESQSSQVGEHRQHGVDEEQRRHGVNEAGEQRRRGVDEAWEQRRRGVDEVGEQRRRGVDEVGEQRRRGVNEVGEPRRHRVDEAGEQRRHGVGEVEEQRRHGVDEAREQRRHGVGEVGEQRREVGDMGCCGACRRNDKIKIKMEIEMSTEQFLQVARELPNIVTTANVHSL